MRRDCNSQKQQAVGHFKKKKARPFGKAGLLDLTGLMMSWKINGLQILSAIFGLDEHDRVVVIESIELNDTLEARNRFVRLTGRTTYFLFDPFLTLEVVGTDLHDSTSAIGHQEKILVVLFVDNHVQRLIAIAEFRNGCSTRLPS